MGKPYAKELSQLEDTYAAAMELGIGHLLAAVESSASLPLFVVGSGGSFTASHFVAALHQRFAQKMAKAMTPLELTESDVVAGKGAVWCLSAGGRNSDIKTAFRTILTREPPSLLVACARTESPLAQLASQYHYVDVFDFDLPFRRDGFLATNSLLAFIILFSRAYHQLFAKKIKLPSSLWSLLGHKGSQKLFMERLRNKCSPLWDRENLVVLYGTLTQAAAHDLESKFTEAALGSIHLADYRNFAHGRHNWLAKRGDTTAVLALSTERDKELAQRTLKLLPQNIPSIQFHFHWNDTNTSIAALINILHIVALAGEARGIDPGYPGVPKFGRKIYHLGLIRNKQSSLKTSRATISIQRKVNSLQIHSNKDSNDFWMNAYNDFVKKLSRTTFSALVFDYDGTLCDKKNRFGSIDSVVAQELIRLLESEIGIGIATGRGKSVRDSLRKAVPKRFWGKVIVGYYNGSDCALLANDKHPDSIETPCTELASLAKALKKESRLTELSQLTIRKTQISIELKSTIAFDTLWALVNEIVQKYADPGTRLVTSGHSIDVLASGISKRSVIDTVRNILNLTSDSCILCIGDRGRWPGNDFELLQEPFSLSADEVSPALDTCWNLAPVGYRGVQATLNYLQCISPIEGGLRFNLSRNRRVTS